MLWKCPVYNAIMRELDNLLGGSLVHLIIILREQAVFLGVRIGTGEET